MESSLDSVMESSVDSVMARSCPVAQSIVHRTLDNPSIVVEWPRRALALSGLQHSQRPAQQFFSAPCTLNPLLPKVSSAAALHLIVWPANFSAASSAILLCNLHPQCPAPGCRTLTSPPVALMPAASPTLLSLLASCPASTAGLCPPLLAGLASPLVALMPAVQAAADVAEDVV